MSTLKFLSVPPKFLFQSILSTDGEFKLSSIEGWDGEDLTPASFGTIGYGAFLSADNTLLELFSFDPVTIADSGIDFIDRGLDFSGSSDSSSSRKRDWPSGTTKVMLGTDTPQVLQWLKDYIDSVAIAGGANASTSIQGFVQIPTQAQVDGGTDTGSTGAKLAVTPNLMRSLHINDYSVDSSSTDDYIITPLIPISVYDHGQIFFFIATHANTGPATLNVSGLGSKDIRKRVDSPLETGDILAGQLVLVGYSENDFFQMIGPTIINLDDDTTGTLPLSKGGTGVNTAVRNTSGIDSRNLATASGVQTIAHGLGVVPTRVTLNVLQCTSSGGSVNYPTQSIGVFDGVNNNCVFNWSQDDGNGADAGASTSFAIRLYFQSVGAFQSGVVSVDATNITITWTKTGSPSGDVPFLWEAFAY